MPMLCASITTSLGIDLRHTIMPWLITIPKRPFQKAGRARSMDCENWRNNFRPILDTLSPWAGFLRTIRRHARRVSQCCGNTREFPRRKQRCSKLRLWSAKSVQAPAAPEGAVAAPKAPAGNPAAGAAYRALNAGHLDEAKEKFQSILDKEHDNPSALSGMGFVAMKQQDFASAADYLQRARTAGARGLEANINTAQFWMKMQRAGEDSKSGNSAAAVEGYRAALSLKPSSVDALEGLGGALAQSGDNAEASRVLERAVRVAPQQLTAWRGLFLAQSSAGDDQAALDTNDRMPKSLRSQLSQRSGLSARAGAG